MKFNFAIKKKIVHKLVFKTNTNLVLETPKSLCLLLHVGVELLMMVQRPLPFCVDQDKQINNCPKLTLALSELRRQAGKVHAYLLS